jgi:ribonuclease-3
MTGPELEQILGYAFTDPLLLEQALTHRSFVNERPDEARRGDNERLEFLGDAVLDLVISEWLVLERPGMDEGGLSSARASLVMAGSLHRRAAEIGLGRHLRLGRGEERTGGRTKPNLLAGALEAVIAALYLDGGLATTRDIVLRLFRDQLLEADGARTSDFKSLLQERLQAEGRTPLEYRLIAESGPDHGKRFRVEAVAGGNVLSEGEGATHKGAEQDAAREALLRLGDGVGG